MMNILGVQIIGILFAIFMLYITFLYWKRKDLGGGEIFLWTGIWLGFIIVTLFPNILGNLTQLLFFARVMDFLMLVAFIILAILGFQNYIKNKRMEKKIEELIRQEALKTALKGKLK